MIDNDTTILKTANVRLLPGTIDRIEKVLKGGELRSAFIRAAIAAELDRREGQNGKAS